MLFAAPAPAEGLEHALIAQLDNEDIELVLDIRPRERRPQLAELCALREMYYLDSDPGFTEDWAAGSELRLLAALPLRHRMCVIAPASERLALTSGCQAGWHSRPRP
jgi:hypothetical protein